MAGQNGEATSFNSKSSLGEKPTTGKNGVIEGQLGDVLKPSGENKEDVMDQKTIDGFLSIEDLVERKSKILDYLKKNCMTPKEGEEKHVEKNGVIGVRYTLTLPSVNGSECKKIKWFVSDEEIPERKYFNTEWESSSSTVQEISTKIFGNMRDFLGKFGVSEDIDMDFENDLKSRETKIYRCNTGDSVIKAIGLRGRFYLKDRFVQWCIDEADDCYFGRRSGFDAKLLMWLTVS